MARLAPFLLLAATLPASALDRGVSGLWYNPSQSGHGFAVTVIDGSTAAVAWYTYNRAGMPVWVSALLAETSPGVLTGNAMYLDGMRFGDFNPATNRTFPWGSLRLSFNGCDQATVDYNGTLT